MRGPLKSQTYSKLGPKTLGDQEVWDNPMRTFGWPLVLKTSQAEENLGCYTSKG